MAFTGQLRPNEVLSSVYNMIISQQVEARNISDTFSELVEEARVDGGLYGDTKLYYFTDSLKSTAWGNDSEATNLLALHRPPAPESQSISISVFRKVEVTLDDYMTKRAWSTEGVFAEFSGIVLGWVALTKKIYEATTYNAAIGTMDSGAAVTDITVSQAAVPNLGQGVANKLADLFVDMKDISRDYNSLGFLRSYNPDDLEVVFNVKYANQMKYVDLPWLFAGEDVKKIISYGKVLPARFFGEINAAAKTADGSATRSLVEQEIGTSHYFAGDLIKSGEVAPAGTSYQQDDDIICKVMVKGSVPIMSGFSVGTSFYNPLSLTTNHYLIWSHNPLTLLADKPMVTIKRVD